MTFNVLVYPNITYARDLEADSYIVTVRSMIAALNARRRDLRFTMLVPEPVESLREFDNVRQVAYPLPTYPNTMRASFDARTFMDAIEWRTRSYDIVWSHLPEHTLAIHNVFTNATNERPVIIGYAHWFEVPENTAYAATMFPANLHGVLAMNECGVNSWWLRDLVLGHADKVLAPVGWANLEHRLTVQHLGVDPIDIVPQPAERVIVFNHRANTYTGFTAACSMFAAMWDRRQDFKVAFTLTNVDAPWATRIHADTRADYLRELSRARVGVGAFRRYSAWSVSVMDGFSVGVPYVLPNRLCYPEMVGLDYPWLYDTDRDMARMVEALLDDPHDRVFEDAARAVARRYAWADMILPISDMFDRAITRIPVATETATYGHLRDTARSLVRPSKAALLKAMGWGGPRVPWTPYRARLRQDGIEVAEPEPVEQMALV